MRRYLGDFPEMFADVTVVPIEVLDLGDDRVLAVQRMKGRARLSGIETDIYFAVVYTLRAGKIVRGREYLERAVGPQSRGAGGVGRAGTSSRGLRFSAF